MSIVFRRDLKRDGSNPTLLDGYGACSITQDPGFDPTLLAARARRLRRDPAYAAAANTARTGTSAARADQAERSPTSSPVPSARWPRATPRPPGLAGQGGSAGGITVGGARAASRAVHRDHRPSLFGRAAFRAVAERAANVPEFRNGDERRRLQGPVRDERFPSRQGRHPLSGGAADHRHPRSARRLVADGEDDRPPAGGIGERQASPCCASTTTPATGSARPSRRRSPSAPTNGRSCSGNSARRTSSRK